MQLVNLALLAVLVGLAGLAQAVVVKLHHRGSSSEVISHLRLAREFESRAASNVSTLDAAAPDLAAVSLLQLTEDGGNTNTHPRVGFQYFEYFGKVAIGASEFMMLFDTSTPNTWIPASSCTTCCSLKRGASPPIQAAKAVPMMEQFPDGSWFSGVSQLNTLTIGDTEDALVVRDYIHHQIFVHGHATLPSRDRQNAEGCTDTVLGLGFSSHWKDPSSESFRPLAQRELDDLERKEGLHLSLIDRVYHEHLTKEPLFSLFLTDKEEGSVIEFGQVNRALVKPDLNPKGLFYIPAVGFPDFVWAFNVPRICFGEPCLKLSSTPARISSGVPYIGLPQDLYELFRKPQDRVPNPCMLMDSLPAISFVVVGADEARMSNRYSRSFTLCAKDYVIRGEDGSCDFGIVPINSPAIVLGTPFLRKFFTVFDIEQKRIGLAQSFDNCKPDTDPMIVQLAREKGLAPEAVKQMLDAMSKKAGEERPTLRPDVFQTHHKYFVN